MFIKPEIYEINHEGDEPIKIEKGDVMYLKNLQVKNFAKFSQFELILDKRITRLVGVNESGKTTLGLDAIWACLRGICQNNKNNCIVGERYSFIGKEGKSAKVKLTIVDEKANAHIEVIRTINKKSSTIKFVAPEDYVIDDNWLKDLLNINFYSRKQFLKLSPVEQAIALGIDTTEQDKEIKELKERAKLDRYDIKSLGDLESQKTEEAHYISIAELIEKKDKAVAFNDVQAERTKIIEDVAAKLFEKQSKLEELKEQIKVLENEISKGNEWVKNCPAIKEDISLVAINQEILEAEENNAKALLYDEYKKKREAFDESRKKLNSNLAMQESYKEEKLEILKHAKIDIKGVSIDESGGLLFNDLPLSRSSRGAQEMFVAKALLSTEPKLKLRFFDDFESLDEKNQKKILSLFLDRGFQVIVAEVGSMKKGVNDILLKEKI